jgi:hypothetical protein
MKSGAGRPCEEVALRRTVLGDEHPGILTSMYNLAEILDRPGEVDGAERPTGAGTDGPGAVHNRPAGTRPRRQSRGFLTHCSRQNRRSGKGETAWPWGWAVQGSNLRPED